MNFSRVMVFLAYSQFVTLRRLPGETTFLFEEIT